MENGENLSYSYFPPWPGLESFIPGDIPRRQPLTSETNHFEAKSNTLGINNWKPEINSSPINTEHTLCTFPLKAPSQFTRVKISAARESFFSALKTHLEFLSRLARLRCQMNILFSAIASRYFLPDWLGVDCQVGSKY